MPTVNTLRRCCAAGACLLALALSGCGLVPLGSRQIDISEAELLGRIASRFPLKQRQLALFDVTLDQPRLRLLPEENRVETEMSYAVAVALTGRVPLKGQLALSYGLRFEPGDHTVRLHQARLERLGVDGLSDAQVAQVRQLGGLMAEDLLKEAVVHRVKPEDLQALARRGYQPGALQVVPGGLRLLLEPLPR